jgi:hypothetical protein
MDTASPLSWQKCFDRRLWRLQAFKSQAIQHHSHVPCLTPVAGVPGPASGCTGDVTAVAPPISHSRGVSHWTFGWNLLHHLSFRSNLVFCHVLHLKGLHPRIAVSSPSWANLTCRQWNGSTRQHGSRRRNCQVRSSWFVGHLGVREQHATTMMKTLWTKIY